jgi:hypothetical protein
MVSKIAVDTDSGDEDYPVASNAEPSGGRTMADGTSSANDPVPVKATRWKRRFLVFGKHVATFCAAAAAVAALVLGAWRYHDSVTVTPKPNALHPAAKDAKIVLIELGGRHSAPDLVTNVSNTRDALHADFVLIAGYGTALIIGIGLALWLVWPTRARQWVWFGLFSAILAIAADCAENAFLLHAISGHKTLLTLNCYDLASVAAVVKFCALVPAAVTAAFGVSLAVVRSVTFTRAVVLQDSDVHGLPLLPSGSQARSNEAATTDARAHVRGGVDADEDGHSARWRRAYAVPRCEGVRQPDKGKHITGIGLSGGGIRAASVALGVLQAPEIRANVLPHAQYLVSVSGGGYTAGAFAQALTEVSPADLGSGQVMVRDPESAFLVGTPEEDHVRRHSSYIADNPAQMLTALGVLAGHLLLTLLLLFGTAIVLGVAAGAFYFSIPLTELSQKLVQAPTQKVIPPLPTLRGGALWALGVMAFLALLFWLATQFGAAHSTSAGPVGNAVWTCARALRRMTAVIAVLTLVLPGLIWFSSWLLHHTRGSLHVASPIAAVLLTYIASLASLTWRKRSMLTTKSPAGAVPSAAPRSPVQILLVLAALAVLIFGWLLVLGGMGTVGLSNHLDRATLLTVLGLLAALVLLGGLTDETTLSLHPFYRRRLASAFAVRRLQEDGQAMAQPYPPSERTTLSEYAVMQRPAKFPHIIFAASATLGENKTPPGRDRVSYTFCQHWVGGPDVGYVKTATLEHLVPPRLARDLTVQGAVALSGAAIAASMGGQASTWYEELFVVTGVRLGAWMPNPAFMFDRYSSPRSLNRPGLPRVRRMDYLLRELFGMHPPDGRLLQVTDGGFYDNLGLIELFRRGCTRIYCVDASGDSPPAASTLAGALTLAYQELGVTTRLDDDTWSTATAGSGHALSPENPLAKLSQRLSKSGIITGTFTYPSCAPYPHKSGRLVVAKASLWPALPYPLMAYAQDTATFPHDSTADQWFDDHQYAAYTELGRQLGNAAIAAMTDGN